MRPLPPVTWRYLPYETHSASDNMAIDEALFRSVRRPGAVPTLRFFGWSPPAVSLGYFQKALEEVNTEACRSMGIDMVRRPTGGKAVLHEHELTYSFTAADDDPRFPGGILGTYRVISSAIVGALKKIGIAAEITVDGRPSSHRGLEAFCFSVPSRYELVVAGKKICGSAQTRSAGAFLQHGSILLDFDAAKTAAVLLGGRDVSPGMEKAMRRSVTSIRDHFDPGPGAAELSRILLESFEETLHVRFEPGGLSAEEAALKEKLLTQKYGSDRWNREGKRADGEEGIG